MCLAPNLDFLAQKRVKMFTNSPLFFTKPWRISPCCLIGVFNQYKISTRRVKASRRSLSMSQKGGIRGLKIPKRNQNSIVGKKRSYGKEYRHEQCGENYFVYWKDL